MWKKTIVMSACFVLVPLVAALCSPSGDEPARVTLPVEASGEGLEEITNDEGWTVTLSVFRLAISDIEFTIEGDTHASSAPGLLDLLIPSAYAHPGHYAGGEVTGELLGDFLLNLMDKEQSLGDGTLLVEDYNGANIYFRTTDESDGLDKDDVLLGHTAHIEGSATKDDVTISFTAILDVEDGTQMVGAPFELTVAEETSGTLTLQVLTLDPFEGDTLLDGLDFEALDEDDDNVVLIEPGSDAHNVFMKTLIRHDHYNVAFESD